MSNSNAYQQYVIAANGSPNQPSICFFTDSQSGFFYKSSGVIGLSISGTEVVNWSSSGQGEVGGVFSAADGSAAAPSYTFTSDADNGMYLIAANNPGFSAGGSQVFNISSAGLNVVSTFPLNIAKTTNQIVLGTTLTTTISATAPASSSIYTIPDVGTSANFVLSAGSQTIGGAKTFSAASVFSLGLTSTTSIVVTTALSTKRLNVASTATIAALSSANSFVKLTGSTATDLQGIAAGVDGQRLVVANLTGQTLTIRNDSGSAASGNKITTMTGSDVTTTGNGCVEFMYDTDASPAVWLLISQNL